mgnify:CR=1 FL=1
MRLDELIEDWILPILVIAFVIELIIIILK